MWGFVHRIALVAVSFLAATHTSNESVTAQDRARTARIEYLIEMLASKNAAPKVQGDARKGDDQTITFPRDYDKSAQVPVYLAVKELLAEHEEAIDLLLAHSNDGRYSFSVNSYIDDNKTVSQVCNWIAGLKVHCYFPDMHTITRSPRPAPKDVPEPFAIWWTKNKHRGLATLQIESIDEELSFMLNVDGKTALPWHADAQQMPLDKFNRLRDINVRKLKAIRNYITETGTPYRPTTLDGEYQCMFGLPWGGRRHNK